MRYYKPISFALMFLILAVLALCLAPGCAIAQSQPHKTFELTIDGQKVVVNLPKDFPSMDTAIYGGERCWDTKLCAQQFCLNDELGHGHVRIFYSGKDVVALNWCPGSGVESCRSWILVKGSFVEADSAKFTEFLDSIWRKPLGSVV